MKFKGIIPALATPLNQDESINCGVLAQLLEHLICITFAIGGLVLGVYVFKKNQKDFILYI